MRRGSALLSAVLVLCGVPAAQAAPTAATVSSDGLHVVYRAAPGQVNHPRVTLATVPDPGPDPDDAASTFLVTIDDVVPITPGRNCSRPGDDVTVAVCRQGTHYEDPSSIEVYLGDRDDRWDGGPAGPVDGGPGDDVLHGNSGDDKLYGGPGLDRLSGGSGRNLVRQN